MGKRQEMRERHRKKQLRNRIVVIVLVTVGVLLVTFFLVRQSLFSPSVGIVKQITPDHNKVQVEKTSIGNPAAIVKMDVWEDFQCSGCMSYSENLEPQILQTYVKTGKVYYTFHFYPFIDGGEGESHDAANAAMCASAQDHFWDYHDTLFANWIGENAGSFTKSRLVAFARNIGLDMTAFNKCFQENTYSAEIQQDVEAGTKLGIPPTPGIFINGKMVISSAGKNYLPSFDDISLAFDSAKSGK